MLLRRAVHMNRPLLFTPSPEQRDNAERRRVLLKHITIRHTQLVPGLCFPPLVPYPMSLNQRSAAPSRRALRTSKELQPSRPSLPTLKSIQTPTFGIAPIVALCPRMATGAICGALLSNASAFASSAVASAPSTYALRPCPCGNVLNIPKNPGMPSGVPVALKPNQSSVSRSTKDGA
ncbi:hypothetical protein BV25DRAFT_622282 [Artomyces pyxidatus]|uniref:Uncharacterized protein n=1 Tax=Artomyces pyxidatus TaxID=48021 RepID=A0ACB8T3K1_9AGAM|nr:hypothetical protein BV25DRAFT_622282 [Artomyces pyxidatus]